MTKFLTKLNILDQEIDYPLIHQQVEEIMQIDQNVQKGQPLREAPEKLGLLPDQFEDVLNAIGKDKKKKISTINNLFNNFRQYLSLQYGIWSVANLHTAQLIKEELNVERALEVMAGNAYWSRALEQAGIKTISTDSLEWAKTSLTGARPFRPVVDLSADSAIKRYRNVDLILCSWSPNFGHSDLKTISAWRKYNPTSHLLFIGERNGATNSAEFWSANHFKKTRAIKAINQSFKSFDFINEQVFEIDDKL